MDHLEEEEEPSPSLPPPSPSPPPLPPPIKGSRKRYVMSPDSHVTLVLLALYRESGTNDTDIKVSIIIIIILIFDIFLLNLRLNQIHS